MKKIKWPIILLVLNVAIICGIVIGFMKLRFPMVGIDYSGLSSTLETFLHYRINGWGIQWYGPSFGGGLPVFANPNNIQFSLLQVLVFFVSPWQSVLISTIIFIVVGAGAGYYFFKRVLKLHWTSSILGTIFFSITGYYLQRMSFGMLGYQTLPLFAIFLIVLLDSNVTRRIAVLIFALVVAILVQQGGYLFIITFALSWLIIFPLVYIYRPALISWKRITAVIALGGSVALLISASKLAAVYAFMRFFPRQIADIIQPVGILRGLLGIIMQLVGTMTLAPLLWLARINPGLLTRYFVLVTGQPYGLWEFDMSLSPVVFAILIFGIYSFIRWPKRYPNLFRVDRKWVAWILLAFFSSLTAEFVMAKGLFYPFLSKLPILSSLHFNARYAVAFIFPLAILAAIIYDKWIPKWSEKRSTRIFLLVNLLTLIPLGMYFVMPEDPWVRTYNITASEKIYAAIRAGDTLNVTAISEGPVSDTQALSRNLSALYPYDPIFGYDLENFHPEIKPGSIWEVSDGYYNMTNPSGYVFPEINHTRPFERIPVSEKAQLEAFASHRAQPGWKIPLYQQILDWVSGLSAAFVIAFLVFFGVRSLVNRFLFKKKLT